MITIHDNTIPSNETKVSGVFWKPPVTHYGDRKWYTIAGAWEVPIHRDEHNKACRKVIRFIEGTYDDTYLVAIQCRRYYVLCRAAGRMRSFYRYVSTL